jgi:hypothetical protein
LRTVRRASILSREAEAQLMAGMNLWQLLGMAAALAALVGLGVVWWRYRHRLTAAEREQARRLEVNHSGRLTDGVLVESPFAQSPSQAPELLFYRYSASGIEYTAAQDISSLSDRVSAEICRPGTVTGVKFDPRRPSNSIVVCEQWSGLRPDRSDAAPSNGA